MTTVLFPSTAALIDRTFTSHEESSGERGERLLTKLWGEREAPGVKAQWLSHARMLRGEPLGGNIDSRAHRFWSGMDPDHPELNKRSGAQFLLLSVKQCYWVDEEDARAKLGSTRTLASTCGAAFSSLVLGKDHVSRHGLLVVDATSMKPDLSKCHWNPGLFESVTLKDDRLTQVVLSQPQNIFCGGMLERTKELEPLMRPLRTLSDLRSRVYAAITRGDRLNDWKKGERDGIESTLRRRS